IVETLRSSTSKLLLCSAFAIADSNAFLTRTAAFLLLLIRMLSACATDLPRISSATKRAICAEIAAPRNLAVTSIIAPINVKISCQHRDRDRYELVHI